MNAAISRAAEIAMWRLVQLHTGKVGYRQGVKSDGLAADPPVIDCSGWVRLLLTQAMLAENKAADRAVFRSQDVQALQTWSDRIIQEIETRTGFILQGPEITALSLPRCATIGLKMRNQPWASNHPRRRGITHIVQVIRRPDDDAAFVSEAIGLSRPGVRLTSLMEWLVAWEAQIQGREAWAVDPFRLAAPSPEPCSGASGGQARRP